MSTPGVNFINIYARVFCTKFWRQSQNVTRKAAKKDVCTKKSAQKNVDEIDGSAFQLKEPPLIIIILWL